MPKNAKKCQFRDGFRHILAPGLGWLLRCLWLSPVAKAFCLQRGGFPSPVFSNSFPMCLAIAPKGGLIGPKNLGDFWVFSLIFNGILMPNWGFNYSKMAKYRFLIDSNIFLTILGTSKILSKSGPVTLPITANLL